MISTTKFALMPKFPNMMPTMQQIRQCFPKLWILRWGLAPFLMLGLFSCSKVSEYGMNAIGVNITSISELQPRKSDEDAAVYIQGKVERQVPLLEQQMYQIDDSTGKVWVLTNQKGWKVGEKVVVQAIPRYESIPISGAELGQVYLEEK